MPGEVVDDVVFGCEHVLIVAWLGEGPSWIYSDIQTTHEQARMDVTPRVRRFVGFLTRGP